MASSTDAGGDRLRPPGRRLNMTEAFLESNLAAGRGEKVALIVDDLARGVAKFTYDDLCARVAQTGHELKARGLGLEDRVFIVLPDGLHWVVGSFAALKIGCTVMFLNPRVSPEELAFYLADSRARGVITSQEIAQRLPADRPHLRVVMEMDNPETQKAVDAHPTALETAPTLEEDFAVWLYSSGSTGAPKAAVHRAFDFIYNTERYAKNVLKMTDKDVTVSVPKLFFGYATGSNLWFPFYFGGTTVVFADKPNPARLFDLVERHGATMLINVPTMIAQMASLWEEEKAAGKTRDLSRLRVLTSAGEALPPELYRRWKAGPGVEILDGIGSAEMFHVFISARFGEVREGSLGTLVEGYDVRVVGPDGDEVPDGEVGTLWVHGDSAAAFYWQRHEKSRNVLQGRWVITSDQFMRDPEGYFYYRGRADDMMKVGGRWVSPGEIEDVLTQHEAVLEAGVAPFEDGGLIKPMAFVVLQPGFEDSDDLAGSLSDRVAGTLAPFKAPRFIEFVSALPRSDRDKLARAQLKTMAADAAKQRKH